MKENYQVRTALRMNKVPIWKLADCLGCHENTLLRRLRHELPEEEQAKMILLIQQIAEGGSRSD